MNDTSEIPDDYQGEALHVNDHGNATPYYSADREIRAVTMNAAETIKALQQLPGLAVTDTKSVPANYQGAVWHLDSHGKVTLYNAKRGRLIKVEPKGHLT